MREEGQGDESDEMKRKVKKRKKRKDLWLEFDKGFVLIGKMITGRGILHA